ncbi:WG repeat-containing protein [Ekhidna sp. To15]|uniref:WG repeat-containing protein n=1 Tax=Ekhidna sp. To15 TaxID=3395267 RepID=UPI003F52860C
MKAEEFIVFEKDGYFGIKDEIGNVTVPAVYEKLGWSNGSTKVHNGLIGFRRDNLWGLITVRNKALTGQKFYTIEPISNIHFKASIKGKFSNHLFHGILDEKGRTIVSFNYFSIEPLGANWLVSVFSKVGQQFGVVSYENRLIIPAKYAAVDENRALFIGKQFGQKLDMYLNDGQAVQLDLDSINYQKGFVAFRDGYAAFLSERGNEIHPFEFKNFSLKEDRISPIQFPEWTIYQEDTVLMKWRCDSLTVSTNGMLIAYLNGSHHLLLSNNTLLNNHELILKEVSGNQLIVQNSKSRKWAVLSDQGKTLITGYDSIHTISNHYGCQDSKGWHLIDQEGNKINRLPLQAVGPGLENQFLAKRNNHWGILDINAKKQATYKYDSIHTSESIYLVSYLNRWGILNDSEEWVVRSEYNEVKSIGGVIIGRRGKGYTIFYDGKPLYKTIAKPLSKIGNLILIEGDSLKLGLMTEYGELLVRPHYDEIRMWSEYFELRSNQYIEIMSESGGTVLPLGEQYQEVGGYGDNYFAVKKEDRWGFIDLEGRLRISNRYDDAQSFNGGLAPVKLRERWGFINKAEEIKIQPYYDHVTAFINDRSIVQRNEKYGLIDINGDEVLELNWKSIRRLGTGNYLVQDNNDQFGLSNEDGSFIFRPFYDHLKDLGDRVLVSKNDAWGILNYDRYPIFKINNEEIKVIGNFIMIKN